MNKKHIGPSLDEFLHSEGLLEGCEAVAIERVAEFVRNSLRARQNRFTNSERRLKRRRH